MKIRTIISPEHEWYFLSDKLLLIPCVCWKGQEVKPLIRTLLMETFSSFELPSFPMTPHAPMALPIHLSSSHIKKKNPHIFAFYMFSPLQQMFGNGWPTLVLGQMYQCYEFFQRCSFTGYLISSCF